MLNIRIDKNDGKMNIALEGRLDTTTAPELEKKLKGEMGDVTDLIVDLAELSYISSAGLRLLLSAQKTMNKQGSMVVRNVSEEVNEIFEMTGFSDILTIE